MLSGVPSQLLRVTYLTSERRRVSSPTVRGASDDRRGFAPVMLDDDRLKGANVRPGSGSLTVTSVDDGMTCLQVDYENDVATLTGTVALVVTGNDEERGF